MNIEARWERSPKKRKMFMVRVGWVGDLGVERMDVGSSEPPE